MQWLGSFSAVVVLVAAWAGACGGTAVIDGGTGNGGDGGASSSAGSGASSSTSTTDVATTGPSGRTEHDQCPDGVCLFSEGICAQACSAGECDNCPQGEVCDECATSACPTCKDCRGACVAAAPGQCDDHGDCGGDEVCLFGAGTCAPACDSGQCADPNLVCQDCVTASCPCCLDCTAACVPF